MLDRRRRALAVVLSLAATSAATWTRTAHADGDLLTARSPDTVATTLDRLAAAAEADGFKIFVRANHPIAAQRIGVTLPPITTLLFGKPQVGVPLIQCDPRLAIELPLRALVWRDAAGQVWLGMVDPAVLKARYGLGATCDASIAALGDVTRKLLKSGAGTP